MPESRTAVPDRNLEYLKELAVGLCGLVAADRAGRKAPRLCRADTFFEAALRLGKAASVVIVTGFLVPETQAGRNGWAAGKRSSWQGPSAAWKDMSHRDRSFLSRRGRGRLGSNRGPRRCSGFRCRRSAEERTGLPRLRGTSGEARDGSYYNMRGEDISDWTLPLDQAVSPARERGIPVHRHRGWRKRNRNGLAGTEPQGSLFPTFSVPCLCAVEADFCLPVDVSNWGCYALAALLSRIGGEMGGAL